VSFKKWIKRRTTVKGVRRKGRNRREKEERRKEVSGENINARDRELKRIVREVEIISLYVMLLRS
jgi:hypothetical protein